MRRGLLFVFFAFMFAGCAAHVGIPQEDFRQMKLVSAEAVKYCDDALYSFNASLNAGIMPRPESFYGDTDYCLTLLREAERRATEFAGKAAPVSRKDHQTMSCYRDHFRGAIEMWKRFRLCYEQGNDPRQVHVCFSSSANNFEVQKHTIWGQCRQNNTDDNSSNERRNGRSDL